MNLRARLECVYGRGDWLQLQPNAHGGMTANLRLPRFAREWLPSRVVDAPRQVIATAIGS